MSVSESGLVGGAGWEEGISDREGEGVVEGKEWSKYSQFCVELGCGEDCL